MNNNNKFKFSKTSIYSIKLSDKTVLNKANKFIILLPQSIKINLINTLQLSLNNINHKNKLFNKLVLQKPMIHPKKIFNYKKDKLLTINSIKLCLILELKMIFLKIFVFNKTQKETGNLKPVKLVLKAIR